MSGASAAQQVQVDDSFGTRTVNWSKGGGAFIRWRPVILDGRIFFCGAYATLASSTNTSRFNREWLRRARVTRESQTVLNGLTFFNVVNRRHVDAELVGQVAACRDTGLTGDSIAGFRIESANGSYRIRR